jgi:NADPH:quinone reductase-like Zn-dependent oxidoreductase
MKAIIYREYGSADVLRLEDVEKPAPREDEVLVKVHAASVNSLDWRRMRAVPFLVRTDGGWLKPKDTRIGADIAGVVEAVGSNVKQFKPGDAVFGDVSAGAFAEFVCAKEKYVAIKPASVSFVAAASTPVAALTALQGLRDHGKIQAGQKVLVNGASGGVGTFAVQIAKSFGAEVTGVCRTRNLEMARSIGADHVIDYTKEDFTKSGQQYDLIYDVAANHSVFEYQRALNPNGICVVAGFTTMTHLFQVMLLGGKKIISMGSAKVDTNDLATIGELLESGKVVPVIDKIYPLSATAEALCHFEEEHARGKIIISVAEN